MLAAAAAKYVPADEAAYFAEEVIETDIRKPPPDKKYRKGIVNDIKSWEGNAKPVKKTLAQAEGDT